MYCTECGARLQNGAAFCTECGTKSAYVKVTTPATAHITARKTEGREASIAAGVCFILLFFMNTSYLGIRLQSVNFFVSMFGPFEIIRYPLSAVAYLFGAAVLFIGKKNNLLLVPFTVGIITSGYNCIKVFVSYRGDVDPVVGLTAMVFAGYLAAACVILFRNNLPSGKFILLLPALILLISFSALWMRTAYINISYGEIIGTVIVLIRSIFEDILIVASTYFTCKWCATKPQ